MQTGVINFAVYENGSEFLGMAKVTLPDVANKVISVEGAGIPGTVDMPVMGAHDAMRATFEFTDGGKGAYLLAAQRTHLLDLRAVHEEYDTVKGELKTVKYKHILQVIPISQSGGDVAPASAQSMTVETSVLSRKDYIDGKLVRHLDPFNFIDKDADGVNRLAAVKKGLGK